MAENIFFRIADIRSFQGGVNAAQDNMYKIQKEADYRATEELRRGNDIYKNVEYLLDLMDEDRKTAEEVIEHNKDVLARMERDLNRLKQKAADLQQAHSQANEAYRQAAAHETKVKNTTVPTTGDSKVDSAAASARSKSLENAHAQVRQASSAISNIESQQRAVNQQIDALTKAIEKVKQTIALLRDFIRKIKISIEEGVIYRKQLQDDIHALQWECPQFESTCHTCTMNMRNYHELAEKAIVHGQNICDYLDPDHETGGDYCDIIFSDRKALGRFSQNLYSFCDNCTGTQEEVLRQARFHGSTMQDAVISETSAILGEVCKRCSEEVDELRKTAKNCKKADVELQSYYSLKYNV